MQFDAEQQTPQSAAQAVFYSATRHLGRSALPLLATPRATQRAE